MLRRKSGSLNLLLSTVECKKSIICKFAFTTDQINLKGGVVAAKTATISSKIYEV